MMDPLHVESLLKFLSIPRKKWPGVLERTVIASVRAFHFLHRVRFGGLAEPQRSELDSEHSDADSSDNVKGVGAKRKLDARQKTPRTIRILTRRQRMISRSSLDHSVDCARRLLQRQRQLLNSLQPTRPAPQHPDRSPLSRVGPLLCLEHAVRKPRSKPTKLAGRSPASCGSRDAALY